MGTGAGIECLYYISRAYEWDFLYILQFTIMWTSFNGLFCVVGSVLLSFRNMFLSAMLDLLLDRISFVVIAFHERQPFKTFGATQNVCWAELKTHVKTCDKSRMSQCWRSLRTIVALFSSLILMICILRYWWCSFLLQKH